MSLLLSLSGCGSANDSRADIQNLDIEIQTAARETSSDEEDGQRAD
jgi:hypothetical protein